MRTKSLSVPRYSPQCSYNWGLEPVYEATEEAEYEEINKYNDIMQPTQLNVTLYDIIRHMNASQTMQDMNAQGTFS